LFIRPHMRLLSIALCLAVLASGALVAGCGARRAAAGNVKITLGFSAWPGWYPWEVAKEEGLFAKNGLDVELKFYANYTDGLNALATGVIDANSQTLNDTLTSIAGGAQQTIVLVNDNSTGNNKIVARDGIVSVADLRGKKVAIEQGTVDDYLLLLALQQAGMSERDVRLDAMPTAAGAAAFAAGEVDAVGVFAPYTTKALQRQGSRAIVTSAEFPGAIPDHLVVKSSLVKDHPDEVQALVDTWFDTMRWIKGHQEAANEIMAKQAAVTISEYRSFAAGTTIFTLQQNLDAFTPGTTPDHLNFQADQVADFMVGTGLVQTRPDLSGLLDADFIKAVPQ
jgi:NitT/TauT family transport system substrate-binding protein